MAFVPPFELKEIVLGLIECVVVELGTLEFVLVLAITRKSYEVEFDSPVMVVLVEVATTDWDGLVAQEAEVNLY
jgi:hypothetical protein